ncbi:MAG: four helix bundle protein [Desulfobacterales bacterium]|nr:four helix bundle protein [Desulfobacterales bacterium]
MERPHKKLDVWKLAIELVLDVYGVIKTFPMEEKYNLTDQLRRAVVSIPSNIAEGAARNTKKEFANFLYIAQGSLSELDTQLEIAFKLGYIESNDFENLELKMDRIGKMISGLIKTLKQSTIPL